MTRGHDDIDSLLEESFSDGSPAPAFRDRVLRDSAKALLRARRRRSCWRWAAVNLAAVFLVAASFLAGRYSGPATIARVTSEPVATGAAERVAVPRGLVDWLEAANLFRQLGMSDRMARAVNRAGNLLPGDLAVSEGLTPKEGEDTRLPRMPAPHPAFETMNRIMAQSFGD